MSKNSLKGFTLVEMLIVMAILIILMGIGVFGGRALINRANRISHTNAVQQLNKAALQYYGDKGSVFPSQDTPSNLVTNADLLGSYLEDFDGGSDASYYYYVNADRTNVMFCVTNGGTVSQAFDTVICEGNAFGEADLDGCVDNKVIEIDPDGNVADMKECLEAKFDRSDWDAASKGWSN